MLGSFFLTSLIIILLNLDVVGRRHRADVGYYGSSRMCTSWYGLRVLGGMCSVLDNIKIYVIYRKKGIFYR